MIWLSIGNSFSQNFRNSFIVGSAFCMVISSSFVWVGNNVVAITVSSLGNFLSSSDDGLVVDKLWSGSCTAICLTSIGIGVVTSAWLRSGGTEVAMVTTDSICKSSSSFDSSVSSGTGPWGWRDKRHPIVVLKHQSWQLFASTLRGCCQWMTSNQEMI